MERGGEGWNTGREGVLRGEGTSQHKAKRRRGEMEASNSITLRERVKKWKNWP